MLLNKTSKDACVTTDLISGSSLKTNFKHPLTFTLTVDKIANQFPGFRITSPLNTAPLLVLHTENLII